MWYLYPINAPGRTVALTVVVVVALNVIEKYKGDAFSVLQDGANAVTEFAAGVKADLTPFSDEQKAALEEFTEKYGVFGGDEQDSSDLLSLIPKHGANVRISDGYAHADYKYQNTNGVGLYTHINEVHYWDMKPDYSYLVTLPDFYVEFDHYLNVTDIKKL